MSKENFETFIDFGSSKIRIAVFDNYYSKIKFFSEKECLSTFNLENINLKNSKKIHWLLVCIISTLSLF